MPSLASFQSVLSRRSSLSHEIRQISPSSCNALQYVYSKLESTQDIRLMTLLPGNFEDLITIELYHVALKPHHPVISAARSIQELTSTLPDGWQANRTTEGRLIFFGARSNEGPQWSHPDPSLDLTDFQLPADGSGEGYEPRYEALSYTWGSPELADTVELYTAEGPRSLGITKNLSIALRYLRYEDQSRIMWCDAICLNQLGPDRKIEACAPHGRYLQTCAQSGRLAGSRKRR